MDPILNDWVQSLGAGLPGKENRQHLVEVEMVEVEMVEVETVELVG